MPVCTNMLPCSLACTSYSAWLGQAVMKVVYAHQLNVFIKCTSESTTVARSQLYMLSS